MSRPVAIVSDSTHYLPREAAEAYPFHVVSLYVNSTDRQQRESEITDYTAFYESLGTASELPTTSQPSIGDFTAVYEPLLRQGHDIVSIHLTGGISGTVSAATQSSQLLLEQGTEGRIEVVDSVTACGGLGLVVLAAAAAAAAGEDIDGVVARAHEARAKVKIWFCLDTLEYLRRGGRVGAAQAWLGGALKIKPILSIGAEVTPVERVRTAGRAFERMVEYAEQLKAEGSDGWAIQHIQAPDQVERLLQRGREIFGSEPVFISEAGPVIGTYAGPGMIGVGGIPRRLLG